MVQLHNCKAWSKYLNRELTNKEKNIINCANGENQLNKIIKKFVENNKEYNVYIPKLSVTNGNCLFDSLCYHLTDINPIDLRKLVSNFMRIYKNFNIFHTSELTLNDMFTFQNDIEYLHDIKNDKVYKYTFDIMCSDLECETSWERLPTELILMCISYIYDAKISIYHNNKHITQINSSENCVKTIYIGLLNESHYIPLDIKKDTDPDDICDNYYLYNHFINMYTKWSTIVKKQRENQKQQEKEQLEKEQLEKEQLEKEQLEKEQLEKEQLEKEQQEKEISQLEEIKIEY
jgi:hypothetical protein